MSPRHLFFILSALIPSLGMSQDGGFRQEIRPEQKWWQSPNVPPILRLAIREQRIGHFVGRRTVEFRSGPQNLRHDEIIYRDGAQTRIEFPTGSPYSGQIIIESPLERRHFMPDKNVVLLLPPRREESYDRLINLAKRASDGRITLATQPGDRVAGFSTVLLLVKDELGILAQSVYIEPKSGVVLKRLVFNAKGAQIGYFQFNQLNLSPGAFSPALFHLDAPGARILTPVDTLREIAVKEGFQPYVLPITSGYRLEESRVEKILKEKVLVESFGSKMGRLTLFELRSAVSPEKLQKFARGDFQVLPGNSEAAL